MEGGGPAWGAGGGGQAGLVGASRGRWAGGRRQAARGGEEARTGEAGPNLCLWPRRCRLREMEMEGAGLSARGGVTVEKETEVGAGLASVGEKEAKAGAGLAGAGCGRWRGGAGGVRWREGHRRPRCGMWRRRWMHGGGD